MDENKLYSLWMEECGNDTVSFDEFKKIFNLGHKFGLKKSNEELCEYSILVGRMLGLRQAEDIAFGTSAYRVIRELREEADNES